MDGAPGPKVAGQKHAHPEDQRAEEAGRVRDAFPLGRVRSAGCTGPEYMGLAVCVLRTTTTVASPIMDTCSWRRRTSFVALVHEEGLPLG